MYFNETYPHYLATSQPTGVPINNPLLASFFALSVDLYNTVIIRVWVFVIALF